MKKFLDTVGILLIIAFFVAVSGCSEKFPATYQVHGTLNIDGVPLANVVVTYVSLSGNPSAIGMTNAEGKYVLTSFKPKDGAMPGDYVVLLIPGDLKAGGEGNLTLQQAAAAQKSKVPVRYFEKETSDLKVTVAETGNNDHVLDIKSKISK